MADAAVTCTAWDCPNIVPAIGVSIGAGLATGVGGALVFFPELIKRVPQSIILGVSLALSAGVMIYVSFIEIFAKSLGEIETVLDPDTVPGQAVAVTTCCFFIGMFICVLLEMFVSWLERKGGVNHDAVCAAHSHTESTATSDQQVNVEIKPAQDTEIDGTQPAQPAKVTQAEKTQLTRMGIITALAIGVHNFPEGLATFLATVDNISSGVSLGIAIAIHNIPEGLCVAMPIYYATGNKWKAFGWSLVSGITEPIGGILGYAVLQPVFTPLVYGIVFSMVGGMMVFIVCHELLPAADRNMGDRNKTSAYFILGMIIMATSLVLFSF